MTPGLHRREVVLSGGETRPYDPAAWHDALVLVARGEVELLTVHGERRRFGAGAVLCFTGLPLRSLCNPGPGQTTLVAISRRATDSFSTGVPSHSQVRGGNPETEPS
ncbi:hypothetical protein [Spirillospora sp. NPDC047279]|uniref:hypothetical protein n=1 Tax=Spirillospora sp. NPDC047279 TaxID=3155478 RepID=UPI0033E4F478